MCNAGRGQAPSIPQVTSQFVEPLADPGVFDPTRCEICRRTIRFHKNGCEFTGFFDICSKCRADPSNQDEYGRVRYVSGRDFTGFDDVNVDDEASPDDDTTAADQASLYDRQRATTGSACQDLKALGHSNRQIADKLGLSIRTVQEHVQGACKPPAVERLPLSDAYILGCWREYLTTLSADELEAALCPPGIKITERGLVDAHCDRDDLIILAGAQKTHGKWTEVRVPGWFVRDIGEGIPEPRSLAERNRVVREAVEVSHAKEDKARGRDAQRKRAQRALKKGK